MRRGNLPAQNGPKMARHWPSESARSKTMAMSSEGNVSHSTFSIAASAMASPPEAAQLDLDGEKEHQAEQRQQRGDDRRLAHAEAAHGAIEQQRQRREVLAAEQRDDAEEIGRAHV